VGTQFKSTINAGCAPTRYREVVLTASKLAFVMVRSRSVARRQPGGLSKTDTTIYRDRSGVAPAQANERATMQSGQDSMGVHISSTRSLEIHDLPIFFEAQLRKISRRDRTT